MQRWKFCCIRCCSVCDVKERDENILNLIFSFKSHCRPKHMSISFQLKYFAKYKYIIISAFIAYFITLTSQNATFLLHPLFIIKIIQLPPVNSKSINTKWLISRLNMWKHVNLFVKITKYLFHRESMLISKYNFKDNFDDKKIIFITKI